MAEIHEVPEHIAYLILLYLHDQLTPAQREELDDWLDVSNDNLVIFEALIDVPEDNSIDLH